MNKCVLTTFLTIGLFTAVSLGCIYNIRDIGYTDLGSESYRLYFFVQSGTLKEEVVEIERLALIQLRDSNILPEIIGVENQNTHPALGYLKFWEIDTFPAAILVSPSSRSLVLTVPSQSNNLKENLQTLVEEVIDSPVRSEIKKHAVKAYCTILLLEGRDQDTNAQAKKWLNEATREIERQMSQMTRPVEVPPHLITLSPDDLSQEKILIWSLGAEREEAREPAVAILYGRGRLFGAVLRGKTLSRNNIFNLLSLLGASCECGLDREWLLGKMIPLEWGKNSQEEVVKLLGFDADNPMVKSEISRVLSLGPGTNPSGVNNLSEKFKEYKEVILNLKESTEKTTVSPALLRRLMTSENESSASSSTIRNVLFITGCIVFLAVVTGLLIFFRARRQKE
jgi:hypothetical protein